MESTVGSPSCLRVGYCLNRDADPLDLSAPDLTESCLCAGRQGGRLSRVHLVSDFLDGAAGNSVNEFKMQYEEELGILMAAEGLESCKSPSSPGSCLHHQPSGEIGLTPATGNRQSASPQPLAPLDQQQRDSTSPDVHNSKQDQI